MQFDGVLSTKEKRNKWEQIVANTIIIPELKVRNLLYRAVAEQFKIHWKSDVLYYLCYAFHLAVSKANPSMAQLQVED